MLHVLRTQFDALNTKSFCVQPAGVTKLGTRTSIRTAQRLGHGRSIQENCVFTEPDCVLKNAVSNPSIQPQPPLKTRLQRPRVVFGRLTSRIQPPGRVPLLLCCMKHANIIDKLAPKGSFFFEHRLEASVCCSPYSSEFLVPLE